MIFLISTKMHYEFERKKKKNTIDLACVRG